MNANELADEAEKQSCLIYLVTEKQVAQQLEQMLKNYAIMLRQQQAEIKTLEGALAQLKHMNKNWSISEGWALEENKKLQAEIEVLKKKIQNMALDLLSAHAQADDHWVELEQLRKAEGESFDRTASHMAGEYVAYPVKELTDDEINKLWAESHEDGIAMQQGFTTQQHYFAHLILRKAQEQ